MVCRNIVPSIITYNTLLDGYNMNWSTKEAMDLFDEIIKKGFKPSLVTYHIMIDTLLLAGLCEDILRIEEPVNSFHLYGRGKLRPDIDVYAILMAGVIKCGKFGAAKFLSHEVTMKGLQLNIRMYTVMINGLCKQGLLTEVKELFLEK
ncbi:pentatricopeptide repeat-containing protein At2g18520, mitochondrial-like [Bidens hawaiensis]|uniref:pentatricopeptide repeat-containing protein At2g18520, mitochondrial-like n=1 Tax=Bidens hawaiensis TaxID=980011 RepID=UPI00404B53EA